MFAATSLSDPAGCDVAARSRLAKIRVTGGLELDLARRGDRTCLMRRRERDGYKVRVPRRRGRLEVAMINTGGGIAAGDRIAVAVTAGDSAEATVTAPAAERAYGAADAATAHYDVNLSLGPAASLHWLPQETILFNRARLSRRFAADIAASAELLIAETVVFGRIASGESSLTGAFRDDWRIRRAGRLVFADSVRLEGDISETLRATAVAGGATAIATLLLVAPDAEDRLATLRRALGPFSAMPGLTFGASAWGGLLLLRALARRSADLRPLVETAIPPLSRTGLPRVWKC